VSEAPGIIRAADGWTYVLTPDDLLWLARSAAYEGGDVASTYWTYASRLVARGRNGTMAQLVRAHSTPVNPRWASRDAPGCIEHPEMCDDDALATRAEARSRTWESLPTRTKALEWAAGRIPNPVSRATDFARDDVSASFLRRYPEARLVGRSGRQWYLAEGRDSSPRASVDWPRDYVTVSGTGDAGVAWLGPVVGIGTALVIGGIVVGIASSR